jgi:hypothetical protein
VNSTSSSNGGFNYLFNKPKPTVMRRISIFSFVFLVFVAFNSSAQCGTVLYNFNSGLTNSFTASGTGTSGLTNAGTSLKLGSVTGGTIVLTTPTLKLPASAVPATSFIDYGFTWGNGGNAAISSLTVTVEYVKNTGGIITSGPQTLAPFTSPICKADVIVPGNIITTGFSAFSYRLIYTFTTTGNGNNGTFLTIDDYTTSSTTSSVVLPVSLSKLEATIINSSVFLKWDVATEGDVTSYEIQRSSDGSDYSKIGLVNASGQASYSFIDTRPSPIAYYRIRSVDAMGRYTYSSIAFVKEGKSMIILKAFPTPFTKTVSVQHATAGAGSLITVSSQDGRLVKSVLPVQGTQQTDIDLSGTTAGIYLLRFVDSNGSSQTLKILKK